MVEQYPQGPMVEEYPQVANGKSIRRWLSGEEYPQVAKGGVSSDGQGWRVPTRGQGKYYNRYLPIWYIRVYVHVCIS